jgi:hypothetical protein
MFAVAPARQKHGRIKLIIAQLRSLKTMGKLEKRGGM